MGGVLASTHSSLALAWTWEAVSFRTSAGVIMATRDCTSQADKQKKCENTNQIYFQTKTNLRSLKYNML